jgi:hypothetical protein
MTYLSVLLPTRQRTNLVMRSLNSLATTAQNPADIEVLIAYDNDDVESHDFFSSDQWTQWLADHAISARAFQVTRWGYRSLHEYYNYLATHSKGSWLFMWNDDALMETRHWDDQVRQNDSWRMLLHITCRNLVMNCSIFPLFHRDWIDLFDTVSPINHPDSWISEVCWHASARKVIDVSTYHDRADLTGNNKDATFLSRDYSTHSEFKSDEMKALRQQWATKLKNHLRGS